MLTSTGPVYIGRGVLGLMVLFYDAKFRTMKMNTEIATEKLSDSGKYHTTWILFCDTQVLMNFHNFFLY